MFNENDIIEFINKIINSTNTDEGTRGNLGQFRAYLELTKMCDNDTLAKVDKVLECFDSLADLKNKLGYVDVTTLFLKPKNEKTFSKRKTQPMPQPRPRPKPRPQPRDDYEDKHYRHYSSSYPEYWSSGCGGGSSSGGSHRSGC